MGTTMQPEERLAAILEECGGATIAVSGGVDSMTLSSFAQRTLEARVTMVHAVSPAVPAAATARVKSQAQAENWRLELVDAGEFGDARYRANPIDRCFFCKTNLYRTLAAISSGVVLSGTNCDDLGDYRPGLRAAADNAVRHPYVEAGFDKPAVRALARHLGLPELAALPASPCLASRIETGIRIEAADLELVDGIESWLRRTLSPNTVRCRVRADGLVIELDDDTFAGLGDGQSLLDTLRRRFRIPADSGLRLTTYQRGSAFVGDREAAE
ncbi:MAG TPA: adenine nucleotide alpha hydrolase [Alphaproteobacteria bacterium]|nr:adenine nucleotide alpha hydrolase [Alphaproteobacteria bacterium]